MIEGIIYWLCAGLVMDAITMAVLTHKERVFWEEWAVENDYPLERIKKIHQMSFWGMCKEYPWWGHLLIIVFPPFGIDRMTM